MPYTVKVDSPTAGDQDLYIHGLGSFRNGTETEISDEQAIRFRVLNATSNQEHTPEGGLKVTNTLGPALEDLDIPGFTFTRTGDGEIEEPVLTNAAPAQAVEEPKTQMQIDIEQAGGNP